MPNTWREVQDETKQEVPKPDKFQGSDNEAWVMTGQDGRLGYEPGTGDITTLEELREMRNPRPVP